MLAFLSSLRRMPSPFSRFAARRIMRSRPRVRLHSPRSNEDAVLHYHNPDADEAVLAAASVNAQTVTLPDGSRAACSLYDLPEVECQC